MNASLLPAALQDAWAEDSAPVRPTNLTLRGSASVGLLALVVLPLLVTVFGLRPDRTDLGLGGLWGFSTIEIALSLALVAMGLRSATPGRSLPFALLQALALLGLGAHLALAALTRGSSHFPVAEGKALGVGLFCASIEFGIALVVGTLATWQLRRGSTGRPGIVALACGLGAALTADGLWRAICPYTDPSHLASHTSGVLLAALVLGGAGSLWVRGRRPPPNA